jgi:uncharacterized lipoprotein YajG
MKSKILAILAAIMLVTACNTPKLPEPTVKYPTPPSELMNKPVKMEIIKT